MFRGVIILGLFILLIGIAQATIWYVPLDFPTIQDAINNVSNGDTIIVMDGTYVENIDFVGKAIIVESEHGPDFTTIDGNQAGSVVTFHSGESSDSILDGFTLMNGYNRFGSGGGVYCSKSSPTIANNIITDNFTHTGVNEGRGGGIYCDDSFATITNNVIINNTVYSACWDGCGGGICCFNSSPTITNNVITANMAGGYFAGGGGVACIEGSCPAITNNTICGNEANSDYSDESLGGAIFCDIDSFPTISKNVVSDNASEGGGGIFCGEAGFYDNYGKGSNSSSSPIISDNLITRNLAYGHYLSGGGISCYESSLIIINNEITYNTSTSCIGSGGGICCGNYSNSFIINNLIVGNSAYAGGGLSCEGSYSTMTNNSIEGNTASANGGGIFCLNGTAIITNAILWHNSAPNGPEIYLDIFWGATTVDVSYSDVEGGQSSCHVQPNCTLNWGAGMIDADPLFADMANNDYHLTWNSLCRDSGDNSSVPGNLQRDFEGDPRITLGTVDMGADEFWLHLYHTGDIVPGGNIDVKVVGGPTMPVQIETNSFTLDPPISTRYGILYMPPPYSPFPYGNIPSNGVLVFTATVPTTWMSGEQYFAQALIGNIGSSQTRLTNLMTLTVE
jgi:hypothetical protein